jgi:hypothetical protein
VEQLELTRPDATQIHHLGVGGTDLAEINPASDLCQRWQAGEHSWRHKSEGGFDASRYTVEPITEQAAKSFVVREHYSGAYPAAKFRLGMFEADELIGVAVFGIPVQKSVLSNPFPDLEPFVESIELSRFVIKAVGPANSETWLLARCMNDYLAPLGVRGVVSFADPVPRVAEGKVLFPGHVGTIYAAANSVYTGRGTARTILVLRDGTVLNQRSLQKVRSQQRGHEYVERRLYALGASRRRPGETPGAWVGRVLTEDLRAQRIRHRGCLRYCFRLGANGRQRAQVRIGLPTLAYPKTVDPVQEEAR